MTTLRWWWRWLVAQLYAPEPEPPGLRLTHGGVLHAGKVRLILLWHPGYRQLVNTWRVEAASDLEAWARFLTRHNLDAPLTQPDLNSQTGNW